MKLFAKQSSSGDGRVFRSGVWSAAIAAAVIVLAVLVNLIVRAIPSRYTEFDLSEAGLYTLSESSRQVADDLTQDVTIYYLAQTGNEDQIISKLLDKYAAQSSHITWELKDPAVYPTFAAQYGAQDLTSGGLILVCGEQSKVLDAAELYDYDYSDYAATGAANVTFDGESRITSAIYQLTSGESRHVYYTTNHGEQALTSTLTDALESQNLTVSALDLLSQTIPEDCDLLVINDPAQDFSGAGSLVDELGQLRSYLSNGGRVLLLTDSYYSTPNLDAVMAEFGLTRTEGLVVEGDTNHYLNGYPALYLLPDYASTEEFTALDGVNTSRRVLLQMAQGITLTETEHVVSDALLVSSDSAYSKPEGYEMTTTEKADGDIAGPFTLAAYARNEESQNLTVSALDLLSQTIPEDCDLLVINDPAQDFSGAGSLVDELGQLRSYLSNGGRVLLLTDSYYSTPNLDAVMAEFGLTRTEGLVVEGDTNHYLNGYPALYLLPDYASTEEFTALDGVNTSRRVLLQMAQGITLTETEHVVSDALLVSSDSAYSKPEGYEMTTTEKADGDIAGPFTLAAYARNEDTGAQVIWVNCGNMDNEGIYQVIPGNVTFLQGCAASLAGQESAVLIDSKALEAAPLEVPGIAASTLGLLFVIVLPAALLAVGAVVVVLRRRK